MCAFLQRAAVIALEEEMHTLGDEQERELRDELVGMIKGSFRPTLIPHPILLMHGRLYIEKVHDKASAVLGGVGFCFCLPGGADDIITMARLC